MLKTQMSMRSALVVCLLTAACSGGAAETEPTSRSTTAAPPAPADETTPTGAPAASPPSVPVAPEPAASAPQGDVGSRANPVALGSAYRVGDWLVAVRSYQADATDEVETENPFNDPPDPGRQFALVTIEATYVGGDSGDFWSDLTWQALGVSNVAYEEVAASCGVIPDDIADAGEAFPGGTVVGTLCWSVTSGDADSLVMFLEELISFEDTRTFFALHEGVGTVPEAPETPLPPTGGTGEIGSRGRPVPLGAAARVGDWEIAVTDVIADATDVVLDDAPFNAPPDPGNQFFMVEVEATYVGGDSGTFYFDLTWQVLGDANVAYDEFNASCGLIPGDVADAGEAFPGGTITGNLCWSVASEEADSLVLILEDFLDFEGTPVFFALGA